MMQKMMQTCVMATTLPRNQRKMLSLSNDDIRDLAVIRRAPEALRAAGGSSEARSEAAVIRAIFEIGLERVREESDAEGYAVLARDGEQVEHDAAMRRRTRRIVES